MSARKGGTWRGQTGPRFRPQCPACGKKGLSPWKAVAVGGKGLLMRECRYCRHVETKEVTSCA
jgi:hypothetical protein